MVSIIVPALNEEMRIGSTLRAPQALSGEKEILVADGGSEYLTVEIAAGLGVRIVSCDRDCGCLIRTAALEANGNVLWFVHADTRPEEGAIASICASLCDTCVALNAYHLSRVLLCCPGARLVTGSGFCQPCTLSYPFARLDDRQRRNYD